MVQMASTASQPWDVDRVALPSQALLVWSATTTPAGAPSNSDPCKEHFAMLWCQYVASWFPCLFIPSLLSWGVCDNMGNLLNALNICLDFIYSSLFLCYSAFQVDKQNLRNIFFKKC